MSGNEIVRLRAEDAPTDDIAHLIATAFHQLEVATWLSADPRTRLESMSAQFSILVAHARDHGQVEMTSDGHAVEVWVDLTAPIPPPARYEERLREACGTRIAQFEALDEALDQAHTHAPHHHLAFLAVRPGHQDRGRGTALLEHHLAELDERDIAGYLEASSPANRRLYARHGFADIGSPITLPQGPHMWPMWRPARGGQDTGGPAADR